MINLSERLMLKEIHYEPFSFLEVFLSVVLIAKILLVIDHLPWIQLFSKYPLIYHVFWQTLLYWLVTVTVHLAIRFASFLLKDKSFHQAFQEFQDKMNWDVFWGVGCFYLMLFLSCCFR